MQSDTSTDNKDTRRSGTDPTNSDLNDDQDQEKGHPSSDGPRQATVNRRPDGSALGVAVFLTGDDLADLGIDPDATDAVDVQVKDGDLELTPAHAEGSDQ